MGGRGQDGKAKALSVNNAGDIYFSNKSELLIDTTLDISLSGWHIFGATSGRGHQRILDISNFKNILIILESEGTADPGNFRVLLFDSANRETVGSSPHLDNSVYYDTRLKFMANNKKIIMSNSDLPMLDMPKIGMVIHFNSVPVGSKIRCRIIGGN